MINVNKLKAAYIACGMTQQEAAKGLGMDPTTFRRKMRKGVFGSDEIEKMIVLFKIKRPQEIFFARSVI